MGNFKKNNQNPLKFVQIIKFKKSHIEIKNKNICLESCENKPCTYYCPSRVFSWSDSSKEIKINYRACIECGACPWGCPYHNINWKFPPGGCGVHYEY